VIQTQSTSRRSQIILITDGQVGNEAPIKESLRAHPAVRLHAFGIDTAVNDALLTQLAAQQSGSCCLMQPTDDIVGAVTRFSGRLRSPVVTEISVAQEWELPGQTAPDLYTDERVALSLRGTRTGVPPVSIWGRLADGREQDYSLRLVEKSEPAIRLLWAKRRMEYLSAQGKKVEAIALAKEHNLLCEGVAFVAWDEVEQVTIATQELYQPSMMLADYACYDIVGSHAESETRGICRLRSAIDRPLNQWEEIAQEPDAGDWMDRILSALRIKKSRRARPKPGAPLGDWYVRMNRVKALPKALACDELLVELANWATEESTSSSGLAALNSLVVNLERAVRPEEALRIFEDWLKQTISWSDPSWARLCELLDEVQGRLKTIRQRERDQGVKILVP
jgi:hypothetical protein